MCRWFKMGYYLMHMCFFVHTQWTYTQNFGVQPINSFSSCTLLVSSNRLILQNMKKSVCRILNSSSFDVFIFSHKRLSEENKRVPNWSTG